MLNSIQHLIISRTYEILKQVQDDKPGLFTRTSMLEQWNIGIKKITQSLNLEMAGFIHGPIIPIFHYLFRISLDAFNPDPPPEAIRLKE